MRKVVVLLALVLVAATGCAGSRGSAAPPKALRGYLDALRSGDLDDAYGRTQLAQLARTVAGASLTLDHFRAFFRANPLREYTIRRVTRLEQRSIDSPHDRGTAFYDIDVELRYDHGVEREVVTVEGDVLGVVQIEPARVFVRSKHVVSSMTVDGVATRVERIEIDDAPAYQLLVLNGPHQLTVRSATVSFDADPLRVRGGPATVGDSRGLAFLDLTA